MNNLEIPPKFIEEERIQEDAFNDYIKTLKDHASKTKKDFLVQPVFVLNSEQTINYITGVYLGTVFFPDEELYEKFSEFGIKRQNLRWMIDINDLEQKFHKIRSFGIPVYRLEFMRHLMVHLSIQISIDVISWSEIYEQTRKGPRPVTLTSAIEKAIDRKTYNAKSPQKPGQKKQIAHLMAQELISMEKENIIDASFIISLMKGQIKKEFFIDWLRESLPMSERVLNSNLFLQRISPLLFYILQHKKIPTLGSIGNKYLGKSENTFQGQSFRKLIFKR